MNFTDLCNEVFTLTARPDLVAETQSAVRAATLRAHHLDYFPKDLNEQPIVFAAAQFFQSIPISFFKNFRALKYLRKFYPGICSDQAYDQQILPGMWPIIYSPGANLPDGKFFRILSPEDTLDSYQINQVDVAYIAGQNIQLKSGDQFQNLLCGIYTHPDITVAGWNSWLANEHPYAIVYDACMTVFKTIGYDEQVTHYEKLVLMEQSQVIQSQILAVGS